MRRLLRARGGGDLTELALRRATVVQADFRLGERRVLLDTGNLGFPLLAVGSLVAMFVFQRRDAFGRAFAASCAFIAGLLTTMAAGIYPNILPAHDGDTPIRLWVPGCSSGEEVYSLAMALQEMLGPKADTIPVQIFGTDVSQKMIDRARTGIYPDTIAADLSPERLRRFFVKLDGNFTGGADPHMAIAAEPDGSVWALWTRDGAVRAERSRTYGATFGALVTTAFPVNQDVAYQLEHAPHALGVESRRRLRTATTAARCTSRAGSRSGRRGLHGRRLFVRQKIELELQRILPRCLRELVDERLEHPREAVAARRAHGAGWRTERHQRG